MGKAALQRGMRWSGCGRVSTRTTNSDKQVDVAGRCLLVLGDGIRLEGLITLMMVLRQKSRVKQALSQGTGQKMHGNEKAALPQEKLLPGQEEVSVIAEEKKSGL
ncbi:hypothetical protein NDU88_000760 [Pleurodeles waltl]|uniref:Uncharacterized protein n=1 Tax=Pleurodeles waltl TaxID=8319 RepID=A0AAV7TI60_PLEWA|nr:hypothetical protein NDU88_000760 [Pleurodeles waltl]